MTAPIDLAAIEAILSNTHAQLDARWDANSDYVRAKTALKAAEELKDEVVRLRAVIDRIRDLCHNADPQARHIPASGTLLIRTIAGGLQNLPETESVYLRSDDEDTPAEPALNTPLFWPVGGSTEENANPHSLRSLGELLWLDDPDCDRGSVELEAWLSVDAVWAAVAGEVDR